MLKDIADILFLNEIKNKGNISKALDWVLTVFRNETKYKGLITFITHSANYDRGERSEEDIMAQREILTFLRAAGVIEIEEEIKD